MHTTTLTDGLGINLGPPSRDKLGQRNFGTLGLGHPHTAHQLRWPYTTRHRSSTLDARYDSSPTLSSSSASSSSSSEFSIDKTRSASSASGSATHDVLLSYCSPALSDASSEGGQRRVYLLSSGLKRMVSRSRSETFRFPLPPRSRDGEIKSAMRVTSAGAWRRECAQMSPVLQEARQGWSPYSSVAPTPRQASGVHRFSCAAEESEPPTYAQSQVPPAYVPAPASSASSASSCSSHTLVSDTDTDSGAETDPTSSADAAKLARLHASLLLLDRGVSELPLSLADSASVEEKMAYLCGLGYRYRRTAPHRHARKGSGDYAQPSGWCSDAAELACKQGSVQSYAPVVVAHAAGRVVSNCASAVASSVGSPILGGVLAAGTADEGEDAEGDVTVRQGMFLPEHTEVFDGLLGDEFSYLVDHELMMDAVQEADLGVEKYQTSAAAVGGMESGLMTPPLTTPELGLDGALPMLLDRWPSPPSSRKTCFTAFSTSPKATEIAGCRPFSTATTANDFRHTLPSTMTSSASCPASMPAANERVSTEPEAAVIARAHRTTISTCSVLTRPRPLRTSGSSTSLFSSASSERLQKPQLAPSVLARPRPVHRSLEGRCTFAGGSAAVLRKKGAERQPSKRPRPGVQFDVPKSVSMTGLVVEVPQRKSSLDVRAAAQQLRARDVHANSVCRDPERARHFHSSASPYLRCSALQPPPPHELRAGDGAQMCTAAGSATKARRRGADAAYAGMPKSLSLPVLFTARTPSQRARGETGTRGGGRKSVVFAGHDGGLVRGVEPPKHGVLVVREEVTLVGIAL